MSTSSPPTLTPQAEALFRHKGQYALTEDELLQLKLHLKMIPRWTSELPTATEFFFVAWEPTLILPRIPGFSREELSIAAYLQPLHSQMCAIALQTLWKANQLIGALCNALNANQLIAAATMARSLVEVTAAFGYESHQLTELWKTRKRKEAPDIESLVDFQESANKVVGQILFGTKLKRDGPAETGIERTNILTLIGKAEKLSEFAGLRRLYDALCDTVHPSIGSNRCFWTQEPQTDDSAILTFVTEKDGQGMLSDLPSVIGQTTWWSLVWLGLTWSSFDMTRRDMCLTANIYALPKTYWGIVRPSAPSDYCICGSAQIAATCSHHFGVVGPDQAQIKDF